MRKATIKKPATRAAKKRIAEIEDSITIEPETKRIIREILELTAAQQMEVLSSISEGIADMAMSRRKYSEGEVSFENSYIQELEHVIGSEAVKDSYNRVYGNPGCKPCEEKRPGRH